jgi:predicted permease
MRLRTLWRNLVHRDRVDRDLDDEMRAYLDLVSDEHLARGKDPDAAARAARIDLGGLQQLTERVREARMGAGVQTLWQDLRYGVRLLRRAPSFAAAAILSLALGIGATSAVFGLLDALQLRSLPVPQAYDLADIRLEGPRCCRHTGRNRQVTVPLWEEIRRHQQAFSALFAFADTRFNLAPQGEVRYVEGLFVSGDFFPVLGVAPALGRTLTREDDRPGCANPGAVISHALWQTEFGGRPDILTQAIRLRTASHPIVGVMPPHFFGVEVGRRFEVALPICASGFDRADHWWLAVMGRLKPGWTSAQADAHLKTIGPSLLQASVPPNYGAEQARKFAALPFSVRPAPHGISPLRTEYQEPLWLLFAIAGLVLVAACANVASLSLVRSTTREPEFALRFALGASKARVLRQLLVEGTLIALAGAAAGLVLAGIAQRSVLALLSTSTDRIVLDVGPDWRVAAFTALVIGVATVVLTLAPAVRAVRGVRLAVDRGRATHSRERIAVREVLVGIQVAMSVVLVSGALLFVLTARNLTTVDRGFGARDLLFAHVFLADGDPPRDRLAEVQRQLTERFTRIPGVAGVAHATTPPLGGFGWDTVIRLPSTDGDRKVETNRNQVSAGYFSVMQTPILAGRDFSIADTPGSPKVAVVNETFAGRFFPGTSPIGSRFVDGDQEYLIVGVVGDSKQYTLREPFRPIAYTAASQIAAPASTMRFVLRPETAAGPAMAAVRQIVAELAPSAGLRFATLDDLVAGSSQRERLMARLAGFFGLVAIALAAVGVYGVVSYTAVSRQREIGIRLALGARASHIMRTVLGRVGIVAGGGLLVGGALTIPASTLAQALLYGVELQDPQIVGSILGVVVGCGVVAASVPARRALRTDPVVALKSE